MGQTLPKTVTPPGMTPPPPPSPTPSSPMITRIVADVKQTTGATYEPAPRPEDEKRPVERPPRRKPGEPPGEVAEAERGGIVKAAQREQAKREAEARAVSIALASPAEQAAWQRLALYTDSKGEIDIFGYLKDHPGDYKTLELVGFETAGLKQVKQEQIREAAAKRPRFEWDWMPEYGKVPPKEAAIKTASVVPIVGTAVTWNRMSPTWRKISIGMDAASVVTYFWGPQILAAIRSGAKARPNAATIRAVIRDERGVIQTELLAAERYPAPAKPSAATMAQLEDDPILTRWAKEWDRAQASKKWDDVLEEASRKANAEAQAELVAAERSNIKKEIELARARADITASLAASSSAAKQVELQPGRIEVQGETATATVIQTQTETAKITGTKGKVVTITSTPPKEAEKTETKFQTEFKPIRPTEKATEEGRGGRRFRLPDDDLPLPPGRYPRKVRWPQGKANITYDLDTKEYTYEARREDATVTPRRGFKVVEYDDTPPTPQRFKVGAFVANVTERSIAFERGPEAKRERVRNDLFKRRRF